MASFGGLVLGGSFFAGGAAVQEIAMAARNMQSSSWSSFKLLCFIFPYLLQNSVNFTSSFRFLGKIRVLPLKNQLFLRIFSIYRSIVHPRAVYRYGIQL